MTFEELLASMDPQIHAAMKRAVELGKWPSGERLSAEQRETCLQAVIAWEAQHLPEEQRTGYIDRTKPDGRPHGPNASTEAIIRVLDRS